MAHNHVTGPFQVKKDDIPLDITLTTEDLGKWYIVINYHTQIVQDEEQGKLLRSILSKLH